MVISHLYIYSVCVCQSDIKIPEQAKCPNHFFFFREHSLIKGPFLTEKGEAEVSGTLQKNSQILKRIQREIKEFTTTYPFLIYIYEIWQKSLEIIYIYICNFPEILQPKLIFVEFFGMLYSHPYLSNSNMRFT